MPSADSRERQHKNILHQMAKTLSPEVITGLAAMNKANQSETRRQRNQSKNMRSAIGRRIGKEDNKNSYTGRRTEATGIVASGRNLDEKVRALKNLGFSERAAVNMIRTRRLQNSRNS